MENEHEEQSKHKMLIALDIVLVVISFLGGYMILSGYVYEIAENGTDLLLLIVIVSIVTVCNLSAFVITLCLVLDSFKKR